MADTRPIRLMDAAPFTLGGLLVTPSARSLASGARVLVIEPRVMQVLVTLHRRCGEVVGREALIDACWDGRTVGDDAVNRTILKLRRALDEIGGGVAVETIAKVGYRLRVDASGSDGSALPDRAQPGRPRRRWAIGVGGAVALAAGLMLTHAPAGLPQRRLVVVEPLRAAPTDAPARRLAQDFAGDLSRAVLGNGRLAFAEPQAAPDRAAAFTLNGSVASVGQDLHAVVTVVAAGDPAILWSHDYTAPRADAAGLRQQVGTNVAAVLVCALGTSGVPDRIDAQTTALYLETCSLHAGDHRREADLLRRVIARAPLFAPAWSDLATSLAFTSRTAERDEAAPMRRESYAAAIHSLLLDPHQGMPYFARALLIPGLPHWAARERLIDAGLAAQPSLAQMYNARARDDADIGRLRDSIAASRRAVALDPLFPGKVYELAQALADAGRRDEAEAVIRHLQEAWPDASYTWIARFDTAARLGDAREAEAMLGDMRRRFFSAGEVLAWRAFLQARAAPSPDRVRSAIAVLQQAWRQGVVTDADLVQDLALLGRADLALALSLRLPAQTDDGFWFRSFLQPLRADPRFMVVARRQGLYAIWRSTGLWPDFCRDPTLPYDCRTAVSEYSGVR